MKKTKSITVGTAAAATTAMAVLGALAPSLAAPAQSDEVRHHDPVGDVVAVDESGTTPSPDNRRADILRADGFYGFGRVQAGAIFHNLVGRDTNTTTMRLRTSAGHDYVLVLRSEGRGETATLEIERDAAPFRCPRATFYVDVAGDKAGASVPARCLGRPRWVRIGIGHTWNANQAGDVPIFADDAHRDGTVPGPGELPALGERVHRP